MFADAIGDALMGRVLPVINSNYSGFELVTSIMHTRLDLTRIN